MLAATTSARGPAPRCPRRSPSLPGGQLAGSRLSAAWGPRVRAWQALHPLPLPTHVVPAAALREPDGGWGGWGTERWNWGYASGTAHDQAYMIRSQLGTPEARQAWLVSLVQSPEEVPWEEVKLALALLWQRSARLGTDGGRGGFGSVMETMRQAGYEGGEAGAELMAGDMEALLPLLPDAPPVPAEEGGEARRRKVAAAVLEGLHFVQGGL